ncbi:MAG: nucleotidyltransferase family protein [Thermoanaerobaculia bacterium]|nr:nucleotidyltransferase family protein [Thermoanaerobaculia bacterium]
MSSAGVVAVVPAAGRSKRMGRDKLLLPWGETVVVGAVVDALERGGAGEIVLVVRPDNRALRRWAAGARVRVALNRRPERGMLSSIREGLEALGGAAQLAKRHRLLVSPGDQPALGAATVRAVVEALARGADVAVPVVDSRRGHPLGVAGEAIAAIPELDPSVGLKALLELYEPTVVPVSDPGAIEDLDRPEEYRRALEEHL